MSKDTTGTTIHIRVPNELKARIQDRATLERRSWTQMAVIVLEDGMDAWDKRKPAQRPRVAA